MNRIIFLLINTLISVKLYAQINPKQGYVITNEGDTIHGTIDYRSDVRNARECRFAAEGEKEYKTLVPADIKGYRFE